MAGFGINGVELWSSTTTKSVLDGMLVSRMSTPVSEQIMPNAKRHS
jgi:hypothetical protein